MSDFITKDSGQRDAFDTGAVRDTQEGKPRYGLIPVLWLKALALRVAKQDPDEQLDLIPIEPLFRLAALYGRGAKKYGRMNFQLGMSFKRVHESMVRHAEQYREGECTEDHLAAVAWNAFALMFYEEQIKQGLLPASLNDLLPPKE